MKQKAVLSILITVLLAVPAVFLSGCATGQVVPPFNPQPIKPAPYNPEPVWNDRTDVNLLALQQIKQKTGQTIAPGGTTATTTGGTTTGGTTGGVTPVPGPAPGPPPTPGGRVPSTSDAIYGYVYDRIGGGIIPGATVTLLGSRGETVDSIKTTATGLYSFQAIQSGSSYKVQASASGYLQIPLSYFEFIYLVNISPVNLYLAYTSPFQELPGASYTALGYTTTPTVSHFDSNGDTPGHYGDVMQTDFYSASTQLTYRALLYDYKGTEFGDGFCSRGWAEYSFYLPDPLTNHYSYDGLWVTLPESYVVSSSIWTGGGTGTVFYYDWEAFDWRDGGSTASGFVQPPFWAVKPTTEADPDEGRAGQVNIIVLSDQDVAAMGPYVLTTIKLAYDYHKDTTAPTVSNSYYDRPTNRIITQVQENAYMHLDYIDESDTPRHITSPVEADYINSFSPAPYVVKSGSTYTIILQDQAGNSGPVTYSFVAS